MTPTLLLALLLSTQTIALPLNDINAKSVTNGQSTLVAWTNEFYFYPLGYKIYIRLLDSPHDRNAVTLGAGSSPYVGTNGRDYLVGWTIQTSRYPIYANNSAAIQLVSAEGVPGTRKVLNESNQGGVTAVVWNGTHWMVAYWADQDSDYVSRVLLLDEALNIVSTVETSGIVRALQQIGERWWAFSETAAIEIRSDGTIGDRFTNNDPPAGLFFVTHGPQPLVLVQGDDLEAIPFDPENGFGARRPFLSSMILHGMIPFEEGSLLLLSPFPTTQYDVAYVDGSGELRSQTPIFFTPDPQYPWTSLGLSANGPLFFFSPAETGSWSMGTIDLYVYRMQSLAPIDPTSGERVSQVRGPNERRCSARH